MSGVDLEDLEVPNGASGGVVARVRWRALRERVALDVEALDEAVAPLVAVDLRSGEVAPWMTGVADNVVLNSTFVDLSAAYSCTLCCAERLKSVAEHGAGVSSAYEGALRQACRVRLALTVHEATLGVDRDDHEVHLRSLCLRVADALAQHYADEGSVADIRQAGQEGDWALCRAELLLLGADDLHLLPDALREEVLTELPILRPLYEKRVAEVIDAQRKSGGN